LAKNGAAAEQVLLFSTAGDEETDTTADWAIAGETERP
jgi:hypothetical protein